MNIRIHRGAHEVGGTCVEVEASGARIVLDVGRPLDAPDDEDIALPAVDGFAAPDPSLLGLFISHYHQDHWGLIERVSKTVPVYLGEATHRILKEAAFFSTGVALSPAGFLRHREPFALGPFTITPFLNDHSAFDTYSLLIEAGGKRVFYSADFQAHGRKAGLFEEFIRRPPPARSRLSNVDVLLMEGTNLRPSQSLSLIDDTSQTTAAPTKTERDVEEDLVRTFTATRGIVLAMYSAQNIDRLVTMFRASKRSGRTLVVDLYGASIAAATGNPNIPQPGFDRLLVYVPMRQRIQVKESREFARVNDIRFARIFPEDLARRSSELVLTFRASMMAEIARAGCLDNAAAVWSMWPGYLERPQQARLLEFFKSRNISLSIHHASGHAYVADLQRFAKALAPKRLVPIHSFAADRFSEFFENVEVRRDGEWFSA